MNNHINSNPDITEAVTNYPETYVFDDNSIVKPKIDVVFKKLFGSPENIHILKAFIASMLDIDKNRITDIRIESSELISNAQSTIHIPLTSNFRHAGIRTTRTGLYFTGQSFLQWDLKEALLTESFVKQYASIYLDLTFSVQMIIIHCSG